MTTATSTKNIHTAMVDAQAAFPTVPFDKMNPAFRSRYSSFTAIMEAVRPILNQHGCYVTQNSKLTEHGVWVQTRIVHGESGSEIVTETELPLEAPTPQKLGGALTYGRRYTLSMALGVVTDEDDDGESTNTKPASKPAQQRPPLASEKPGALGAPQPESDFGMAPENGKVDPERERLTAKMHAIGTEIWGKGWDDVRHTNIGKLTNGRTESSKELTMDELHRVVDGLKKKQKDLREAARQKEEKTQAAA